MLWDIALVRRQLLSAVMVGATAGDLMAVAGPARAAIAAAAPRDPPDFPRLRRVRTELLEIEYAELGRGARTVVLLHGWPYDIHSFAECAPLLAARGFRVIIPYLRGFGATSFLSPDSLRNGQPAAVALDTIALMDALGIDDAIVAGFDWGARSANIIAALWPERCAGLISVSGYLISSQLTGAQPLPPAAELQWWYQFYFATERGRAGYAKYRRDFARLIWQIASPRWKFDDVTFNRSAAAFDNPDHVDIVVHNYRWRQGLISGDSRYDAIEAQLAQAPSIIVPTITLEGDANGAPHPDPAAYRGKFAGTYQHRFISGGIGHNLPQEAPQAFADAVLDVAAATARRSVTRGI